MEGAGAWQLAEASLTAAARAIKLEGHGQLLSDGELPSGVGFRPQCAKKGTHASGLEILYNDQ